MIRFDPVTVICSNVERHVGLGSNTNDPLSVWEGAGADPGCKLGGAF